MTARILSWDWRGQPNLDNLAKAVADLSAGQVHIHQVDTGSDSYAIVVSDQELTDEQVQAEWDQQWDEVF